MLLCRCGSSVAGQTLASAVTLRALSVEAASASGRGEASANPPHVQPDAERVVPFKLSRTEARNAFNAWCSRKWLHASSLWGESSSKDFRAQAEWLPFWAFTAEVELQYRGVLGFPTRDKKNLRWQAVLPWRQEPRVVLSSGEAAMQVYASYQLRRDFVATAATGAHAAAGVPFDRRSSPDVLLPQFQMPRSLAWRLAQRSMERMLRSRATAALLSSSGGATQVRDLELETHIIRVTATPVRLPVYVLSFTHGTILSDDQSIVPERFTAIVGAVSGQIGAVELLSPRKAQVAAAAPFLFAGLAAESFVGGASFWSIGMESAFLAAVAGVLAGLAARRLPYNRHTAQEAALLRANDAEIEEVRAASGPAAWVDERVQRRRDDSEWLRWEETGLWGAGWDPARREEWATSLFRSQVDRARERAKWRRQQAELEAFAEEDARRQAAKAARWGDASSAKSGHGGQVIRDPLGYYRTLGLPDARVGVATDEEIKAAFRKQAQRLHPDKHTASGDVRAAADAFRKLQVAYSVLRDERKRGAYVRGGE